MTSPIVDADHQHWCWRAGPISPSSAVVFDLDGVLSDASGRQHYLEGANQDWDGFFGACDQDTLLHDNAKLLEVVAPDHRVVILTARPLWVRGHTLSWLAAHGLRWDLLIMRDQLNWMPSAKFKAENAKELGRLGFELLVAFEDDARNVEMYRKASVPCVYLHSGYYD